MIAGQIYNRNIAAFYGDAMKFSTLNFHEMFHASIISWNCISPVRVRVKRGLGPGKVEVQGGGLTSYIQLLTARSASAAVSDVSVGLSARPASLASTQRRHAVHPTDWLRLRRDTSCSAAASSDRETRIEGPRQTPRHSSVVILSRLRSLLLATLLVGRTFPRYANKSGTETLYRLRYSACTVGYT